MKTKIISSILLLLSVHLSSNAQHTAITTTSSEIDNNLDLKAVAYLFGNSNNLEDFEEEINSPQNAISNLDLNRDGYVDYLRVVETNMQNVHTVNIQAVLGNDLYQDVATIGVQKDSYGKTYVRMIGNERLYGYNYVINPVYVNRPLIVANFWKPNHKAYQVSYHRHYPVHYTPRIVTTAQVHKKHLNYYATAYYNTNRPTVKYHSTVTHHKPNVKNYTHNNASHHNTKSSKNPAPSYYGKSAKSSQPKASKLSSVTVKYSTTTQKPVNTRVKTTSVRTTSVSTSRPASTSRNTSTVTKASNSRSVVTTRTQKNKSTRSTLAMK